MTDPGRRFLTVGLVPDTRNRMPDIAAARELPNGTSDSLTDGGQTEIASEAR
jgi:hypothetical protein